MHPRTTITPQLRDWIRTTTRDGHSVTEVLRLMKDNGYDPRQSRSIVAEVLKLPLAALNAPAPGASPRGLRTRHPEAPEVDADGHLVGISLCAENHTLRVLENLLAAEECDELIALAQPRRKRALTLAGDGSNQVNQRRTIEGMFFTVNEVPLVGRIEQRLATLLGMPVSHG